MGRKIRLLLLFTAIFSMLLIEMVFAASSQPMAAKKGGKNIKIKLEMGMSTLWENGSGVHMFSVSEVKNSLGNDVSDVTVVSGNAINRTYKKNGRRCLNRFGDYFSAEKIGENTYGIIFSVGEEELSELTAEDLSGYVNFEAVSKNGEKVTVPVAITVSVGTRDIYVDKKKGSDSNLGGKFAPFKTIQKALDTVLAGQTVYVHKGTYIGANQFKSSGRYGSPITLKAVEGERVKLKAKKSERSCILDLNGKSNIRIEGLELCSTKGNEAYGILMENCEHDIVISGNKIHHISAVRKSNYGGDANAILCFGDADTDADSIHDIVIENNEVYRINPGWSEAISVAGNARDVIIRNNKVHHIKNIGIDVCGNFSYSSDKVLDQPRNCEVYGNTTYRCRSPYAACAGIYVDGARDIKVHDNVTYANQYGIEIGAEQPVTGYPTKNIEVYNNEIRDNLICGIRVGGYFDKSIETGTVENTVFRNNTLKNNNIKKNLYNGEIIIAKCSEIAFTDNTFYKKMYQNKRGELYPIISTDFETDEDESKYINNITFTGNKIVKGADGQIEDMEDDWTAYLEQ